MSLREEFKDRDYRQAYAESFSNTVVATQLRLLRGSMTQKEFAELVGIHQSRVSAMEDENYSGWSTRMLRQIAARRDVVYLGRFYSFGELLNHHVTQFSENALRVPDFDHDPVFAERPSMMVVPSETTTTRPSLTTFGRTTIYMPAGSGKSAIVAALAAQRILPLIGLVNTGAHGVVTSASSASRPEVSNESAA